MRRLSNAMALVCALSLVVSCGDDETGSNSNTTTGGLKAGLQGTWKLTKFSCAGADKTTEIMGGGTVEVTIADSKMTLKMGESACMVSSENSLTFDDTAKTATVTQTAANTCDPANCSTDQCGKTEDAPQVWKIGLSGSTFTVAAPTAGEFPDKECTNASLGTPGEITLTKQ